MRLIATAALVCGALAPASADAFCGFYVASTDRELFNHATIVVLMREGTTTVLSMQNDYEGPTEDFALVVPVPSVLREEQVKTLPRDVFERVERMAAPRLVEYWEDDPCSPHGGVGLGTLGTIGFGGGSGSGYGRGAGGSLVVVEAEFAVGEYDIVILSARDSSALETWLRDGNYRIPQGASETLRPYVEAGMKFFVAKVDSERVAFQSGRAVLSPLRVEYESQELSLPVRLGLINSSGTQDLIVHVLARNQRYEVANYPNATIPTNLDVRPDARERFGEFYAALFDRTVERNPGAVITEYAWLAGTCDPCPGDTMLTDQDLVTLGARQTPSSAQHAYVTVPEVRMATPEVRGPLAPEIVRRVLRRNLNHIRFCYEQQLAVSPDLEGRVQVAFEVGPTGRVASAEIANTTLANASAEQCIAAATRRWTFPAAAEASDVRVVWTLRAAAGAQRVWMGGGPGLASEFVLTRLHYRYGSGGLAQDLVFREAGAIAGGREIQNADGRLEEGALPAPVNNFQARYAIRHPWEGPIACAEPVRGRWTGAPPEGAEAPATRAATDLGAVARGGVELRAVLASNVPALGITGVVPFDGEASMERAPAASEAVEMPAPAAPPRAGGCGCSTSRPSGFALALLVALLLRRRR
jgi:MYXO-CTERM domain-containing protein